MRIPQWLATGFLSLLFTSIAFTRTEPNVRLPRESHVPCSKHGIISVFFLDIRKRLPGQGNFKFLRHDKRAANRPATRVHVSVFYINKVYYSFNMYSRNSSVIVSNYYDFHYGKTFIVAFKCHHSLARR